MSVGARSRLLNVLPQKTGRQNVVIAVISMKYMVLECEIN